MKKILVSALVAGMLLSGQQLFAFEVLENNSITEVSAQEGFEKAKDQVWPGKDMVWYKLDKSAKVWWSKDGKKWEAVKDGMWQDQEGKWLKIGDKKLWWSADGGKTWSEVPEWKWLGADGKWYKFDKDWTLWVNM